MQVMLERCVDPRMVRFGPFSFEPPMQVAPITVEEHSKFGKHKINVCWHYDWEERHWQRAHELVDVFISNHSERAGIEEHMMMLVIVPEEREFVPEVMIKEFPEIGSQPYGEEQEDVIPNAIIRSNAAEALGFAMLGQVESSCRAKRAGPETFEHLKNLLPYFVWLRKFWVALVLPFLKAAVPIVVIEQDSREEHDR